MRYKNYFKLSDLVTFSEKDIDAMVYRKIFGFVFLFVSVGAAVFAPFMQFIQG